MEYCPSQSLVISEAIKIIGRVPDPLLFDLNLLEYREIGFGWQKQRNLEYYLYNYQQFTTLTTTRLSNPLVLNRETHMLLFDTHQGIIMSRDFINPQQHLQQ